MQSWASAHACLCSLFGSSVLRSQPEVAFAPLLLCPLCSPQLRAKRASDPSKCPRDQRRWGSSWASVQVALPSSSSSWGPSLSSSVKGEWDQCPDPPGAPTLGKPAGHRGDMAGVGRAARLVAKYVEGCQPGHWACGLTHTGQWKSETQQRALLWLEHRSGWCQVPLSRNEYSARCQGAVLEAGSTILCLQGLFQ